MKHGSKEHVQALTHENETLATRLAKAEDQVVELKTALNNTCACVIGDPGNDHPESECPYHAERTERIETMEMALQELADTVAHGDDATVTLARLALSLSGMEEARLITPSETRTSEEISSRAEGSDR